MIIMVQLLQITTVGCNFEFQEKGKTKKYREKQQKEEVLKNLYNLFEVREQVFNAFYRRYFQ